MMLFARSLSTRSLCETYIAAPFKILYLFTKSDLITILMPVVFFVIATATTTCISRSPSILFWTWLNLLPLDVSNQIVGADEDRENKPYRPIPAGLIDIHRAKILRWILLPICYSHSYWYGAGVAKASLALSLFAIIYNELDYSRRWVARNILNGAAYACFEWGAFLIAENRESMTDAANMAVWISFGVITTTMQAQDFRDIQGDLKSKRLTLPILYPTSSRYLILLTISGWCIVLSCIWDLGFVLGSLFSGLGIFVGLRFFILRAQREDEMSYKWYNIWLTCTHMLPWVWRYQQRYYLSTLYADTTRTR